MACRRNGPSLVELVGDPRGRGEIELRKSFVRVIQDRIDDDVQWAQMPTEDRADFLRVAVLIPVLGVVAELEVHPVDKVLVGGMSSRAEESHLDTRSLGNTRRAADRVSHGGHTTQMLHPRLRHHAKRADPTVEAVFGVLLVRLRQ
jgi:hypothetical protein